MGRSQLNINISPDLLRKLKGQALRSNMTVTEFVTNTLESVLDENDELTFSDRLLMLEEKVKQLTDEDKK